jgi:hypothetical protein
VIVKSRLDWVVKYKKVTNKVAPKWSFNSALATSKEMPNIPNKRTNTE